MVCDFSKFHDSSLEVAATDNHRCRYHKKGLKYSDSQMIPKGLCAEAFHSIYPFALGLLYRTNSNYTKDSCFVRCPEGNVIFEVRRVPKKFLKRMEFQLKRIVNIIYPVDPREYDILISVSESSDTCAMNHGIGQEYEFNQEKKTELCPAAFDSLFPFVYATASSENNDSGDYLLSCQDHLTNIVFNVSLNQREEEKEVERDARPGTKQLPCEDFSNIWISIKSVHGKCDFEFNQGQKFKFEDMVPDGICISAYHNMYPYIFTLENGGYFTFKMKDKNNIVVQCPSSVGRVAVEVMRDNRSSKNHFTVIQTKGPCPMDMKVDTEKVLPDIFSRSSSCSFCPKLFDAIFPYVNKLNLRNGNQPITVSCPNYPDNVTVEISKNE